MNEKLTKILEEAKNDDEFRKELIKTRDNVMLWIHFVRLLHLEVMI
ncbi:MAG: hypothetical protein ACLRPW_01585 [Intestinibacter sp.]